jgi:hypothetical protein
MSIVLLQYCANEIRFVALLVSQVLFVRVLHIVQEQQRGQQSPSHDASAKDLPHRVVGVLVSVLD